MKTPTKEQKKIKKMIDTVMIGTAEAALDALLEEKNDILNLITTSSRNIPVSSYLKSTKERFRRIIMIEVRYVDKKSL